MAWLNQILKAGPMLSSEIHRKAIHERLSHRAIDQARRALEIRVSPNPLGQSHPHFWALETPRPATIGPEATPPAPPPEVTPALPPEPPPREERGAAPEERMATNEEITKLLENLQVGLDRLKDLPERVAQIEARAVPVDALAQPVREVLQAEQDKRSQAKTGETLQKVVEKVTDLEKKVATPDPRLTPLVEKADVLVQLCELHPGLCKLLEPKPEPAAPTPPATPLPPDQAHGKILGALEKVGIETIGRVPTWSDLMDLCPGGECREGVLDALARHPELLKKLAGREGVADVLIEGLKEAGKLTIEPEGRKPPAPEEVASGADRGWFGRIPRSEG